MGELEGEMPDALTGSEVITGNIDIELVIIIPCYVEAPLDEIKFSYLKNRPGLIKFFLLDCKSRFQPINNLQKAS